MSEGFLRIGEVSRRTGVAPEVLRAWEGRYGLLRPDRSPGGFRLYGEADVERVDAMRRHLAEGLSAAQAAERALAEPRDGVRTAPDTLRAALSDALDALDEAGANAAFDAAVVALSVDALLAEVVLPYLAELGSRWEAGDASVAQEHFASAFLQGRLLGLARGWGRGGAPHALLACGPGEEHELPLVCFGLALRARAWRVTYLGARTPVESVVEAVDRVHPDVCVVSATVPLDLGAPAARLLRRAAAKTSLTLAGPGADAALARRLGATLLERDVLEAAAHLG